MAWGSFGRNIQFLTVFSDINAVGILTYFFDPFLFRDGKNF